MISRYVADYMSEEGHQVRVDCRQSEDMDPLVPTRLIVSVDKETYETIDLGLVGEYVALSLKESLQSCVHGRVPIGELMGKLDHVLDSLEESSVRIRQLGKIRRSGGISEFVDLYDSGFWFDDDRGWWDDEKVFDVKDVYRIPQD